MIKKQLLYSLVFSYVAVLVVGIGLYTSLNKIATESIEEEITKNYTAMLDDLVINMNYILEDVRDITLGIKEKASIKDLLFLENLVKYQDNYKFVKAVQDLKEIRSYNSFIEETYIYYDKQEIILNSRGTYSPEVAYKSFHAGRHEYYDEWIEVLNSENYAGKIVSIDNNLIYIQTISTYKKESHANIVVVFDKQRLNTFLKKSTFVEYGHVAVMDEEDNVLVSNLQITQEELEDNYKNKKEYTILKRNDTKNNLKYVGIIPENVFRQKVSYINKIFLVFTLIFIMIVLIGIQFIYRKYDQIRTIVDKVKSVTGIRAENQYGELEYIEKALVGMHRKLEKDKYLIAENIFRKAIHGSKQSQEDIDKYLGEHFSMSHFIIGSLVLEQGDKGEKEKINDFIIQNIFKEVLGDGYNLYTIDYHEGYILIIGLVNIWGEYIYEEAIHRLSVGRNFLEEKFGFPYSLSISDIHTEIGSLATAYEEVQKILEYRMFFSEDKMITYNEILKEDIQYIYSIEEEIGLIKYIKEGSIEKAISSIEKIFYQNFTERNLSLRKTKELIYDISVTLEHVGYDLEIEEVDFVKRINKIKGLKYIQLEFEEIIYLLCNKVHSSKVKKIDDRVQRIIEYIEMHYQEEDLTVTAIAEAFDMKVSYVSRFFKENTGENLLQYITKCRIEQAKKLLVETDLNLNLIAGKVGLLNNVALIRSFKKYEYITPNEYRNANK